MKHPYFEGVFSFPHGEPGLRHAFVRQLLPTCTASPSQAAIRRCWCRPPVCVLCNQRLIDSPCALFFCKWSGLIPAASSSVWTIISQAVLPSCSSSDPPTPIPASFIAIVLSFVLSFCSFFALTPIISSGLICCSFPLPGLCFLFFLPTNGLIGSGSQSATPVGGKITTTTSFQVFCFFSLSCPEPHLSPPAYAPRIFTLRNSG